MLLPEILEEARRTGNYDAVVGVVPYARFMGFSIRVEDGDVLGMMRFGDHIVGNPKVGALHGGTLGALMEFTGIFKLLHAGGTRRVPKTVNVTIEYLRSAAKVDTFARAHFIRHGRRIANVRIEAFQDDPSRPVAAANAHFLLEPDE
ncbi:MAG: PaaI family thioesterase [Polyangiaceae bacterium]|nr:PaaI family thioesterase [Polyangiaceae bacterium]